MKRVVRAMAAALGGIVLAEVLDDVFGLARFGPSASGSVAGILAATLGGAAVGALVARGRRAVGIGGILGGTVGLLAIGAPFPWIDLGPFGAGPGGELALLVLPCALVIAALGTPSRLDPGVGPPRSKSSRHLPEN